MIYVLKYKLKSEKKEVIIKYYDKDEVLYIIKQINRWLTPIKDSLINWIETLEYINVQEQNYDYIKGWLHYDYKKLNVNWEIIEIPELSSNIDKNFIPQTKDITAELFYENNIGLLWKNKIIYKNWILSINWEIFKNYNENTKYWEIIDLIFKVYEKLGNNFLYTDLENEYNLNTKKYKRLIDKDFKYINIRDTIKNKLNDIKKYFNLKQDIVTLTKKSITINNG
jgi:hypothetical protein